MLPPADRIPNQDQNSCPSAKEDPLVPDRDFQVVGPALRILQLNVESLSATKRNVISVIADKQDIDIICLQETHVDKNKASLFSIPGFDLVSYVLHQKHGRAMYIRGNISDVDHVLSTCHCDVMRVGGFHVANVYKPPSEGWEIGNILPIL